MRMMSYILLYYIKNLLTPEDFDALLVHKKLFTFWDQVAGAQLCGFLLLAHILQVCSPSTLVDIEALEKQLEAVTLQGCGGNYVEFTTEILRLHNLINVEAGRVACTQDKLGRVFFTGCKTWPNAEWKAAVGSVYTDWLLKKSTNLGTIMKNLGTIVNNQKTLLTWDDVTDDGSKHIALHTQLVKQQKKMKARLDRMSEQKTALSHHRGDSDKKNWQFKKDGEFANHPETGAKYVWCNDHGTELEDSNCICAY